MFIIKHCLTGIIYIVLYPCSTVLFLYNKTSNVQCILSFKETFNPYFACSPVETMHTCKIQREMIQMRHETYYLEYILLDPV